MSQTIPAMFPDEPTDLFGRVTLAGSRVAATEAAAFETLVGDSVVPLYMRMLFHIRPHPAEDSMLHAAQEAFAHMIGDCMKAEKERYFQVTNVIFPIVSSSASCS